MKKKIYNGPQKIIYITGIRCWCFYVISSLDNTENEKTEKIVDNTELASDEDLLNSSNESDESPKIIKPGNRILKFHLMGI